MKAVEAATRATVTQPPEPTAAGATEARDNVPVMGYRNYWYPAAMSRALGRKPLAIRLLGEDIVLFRSGNGVHALQDRCAHRGTPLSIGRQRFPGTITCAYHGWTFDGQGLCVAVLNEGPDSRLPGKASVLSYPVAERAGTIWVFVGDMEAPPLERDIPPKLIGSDRLTYTLVVDWKSNWRLAMENVADPSHDNLVHRSSIRNFFKKIRVYRRMQAVDNTDGNGFYVDPGFEPEHPGTEFPGVGRFPEKTWWRKLNGAVSPTLGGKYMSEIRLPGYLQVNTRPWEMIEWSVPVDAVSSRQYVWFVWQRSRATRLWGRMIWRLAYRFVMQQFLAQDGWIVEAQQNAEALASPEKLSRNDVGVIRWRKLSARARGCGSSCPRN